MQESAEGLIQVIFLPAAGSYFYGTKNTHMKTIIVPTDFSPVSENAMWFAADMAKHVDASLFLLHVYQLPVTVSEVPLVMISADELKNDSDDLLKDLKEKIEQKTGGKLMVRTESRFGNIAGALEDVCDTTQPFAVVMGSQGAGRMERIMFGSSVLTAIRRLHVPVMVIPPGVGYKPVRKIGLACDFRNVEATLPQKDIKDIVRAFGAELHVLNVGDRLDHMAPSNKEQSGMLHLLLDELHPQYHYIHKEKIEESLDEFAQRNNLDFLIVIPKKHAFPESLFHKSHSGQLATHAHVPVMAIHE